MAAGRPFKADLINLGGGLNQGQPAAHIADNEWSILENWQPFSTKLRRRGGTLRVTSSPYAEKITGLFAYKLATGTWLLLAGAETGLAKLDGTQLVTLPVSDGQALGTSAYPWTFRQYQGEVLACRKATGTLKRVTPDNWQNAGIEAPSVAPTIADGGAGVKLAGDHQAVYTFYNRNTGAESNPSPTSSTLTLAASKRITWASVQVSPNGQVNARRLYLTLAGQTGEFYFVQQVNDNFTVGGIDDNVLEDAYGGQASFDNGMPPSTELFEIWNERGWCSDGKDLFFSELGKPQSYGALNIIPVYPDDGHRMTAVKAWGSRLALGKTNGVHFLTGVSTRRFDLDTITDKHGCVSNDSMQAAEGALFWYSGENIYRSEGLGAASISTVKVRDILDRVPDAMKPFAMGAVYPTHSWYVLSVAQDSSATNQRVLAYNYKTDSWTVFKYPADAPAFLGRFFDAAGGELLYASLYDKHLYQLDSGNDDYGNAIVATARGKAFGLGEQGKTKGIRRVSLLCDPVSQTVALRAYNDHSETPAASRSGLSLAGQGWKRYMLSTLGNLGALIQVEIEYAGSTTVELEGLIIEGQAFDRQSRPL